MGLRVLTTHTADKEGKTGPDKEKERSRMGETDATDRLIASIEGHQRRKKCF